MKILNLLEIIQTDVVEKNYNGTFRTKYGQKHDPTLLGTGYYSNVRKDKTSPHQVVKNSSSPSSGDKFQYFARYIAEPGKGRMDNVHIPKIYAIGKYTDKNGSTIQKYKMERLRPLHELSHEEVRVMMESLFDVESDPFIESMERYSEATDNPVERLMGSYRMLSFFIKRAALSGDYSFIASDELIAAIGIIRKVLDKTAGYPDIHDENVMFRRTSVGPQLVISDPIS